MGRFYRFREGKKRHQIVQYNVAQSDSFASHWSLDPGVAYLNHGAFGACPKPVLAYQSELRAWMEFNPMQFLVRECHLLIDKSRQQLASLVGTDAANLVFSQNISASVSAVLRSVLLRSGDEILVTDHGYSSCTAAAKLVAGRVGASVTTAQILVPVESEDQVVDAILDAVTERTRLALIDHIPSSTAVVFPVRRIINLLKERGIRVLVDGAHAPGVLPLQLDQIDADWYVGHCHKWLCAPKGASFLYASPAEQQTLDPLIISHGLHSTRKGRSRFHDVFDWAGTFDPTAWCSVGKAIDFLEGLLPGGLPALQQRNHNLVVQARRHLLSELPAQPTCPESMLGSMASLMLPEDPMPEPRYAEVHSTTPVQAHQMALAERDIELPWMYFPSFPKRMIRISAHAYNNLCDFDVADSIRELLESE